MNNLDNKLIFEAYEHINSHKIKVGSIVKIQVTRTDNYTPSPYPVFNRLNGEFALVTHVNKDSYSIKLLDPSVSDPPIAIVKRCVEYVSDIADNLDGVDLTSLPGMLDI